jgi:hypothetical protein
MSKVAEFHCWIEEDAGKFTGHFEKDGKIVQLYEGTGSIQRAASRLTKVGMADMIKQFESIQVFPVGVTFTHKAPADPVEHIPEDVLAARKAQIGDPGC